MRSLLALAALILVIQVTCSAHVVRGTNRQKHLKSLKENDFECPHDGHFPHDECEKYYICSGGNKVPTIGDCDIGTDRLYNVEEKMCDYAWCVHCGDRIRPEGVPNTVYPPSSTTTTTTTPTPSTTTPTTRTTPSTTSPPFTNCTTNGAVAHPLFCDYYYDCWEGISTLLRCPNSTLFDVQPEWSGCAPPDEVDCGNRIRPNPTEEFVCPEDEDGGRYPDHGNCAAFYTCSNGAPIHQLCPSGLVFNKELRVCDHLDNVDCSDRARFDVKNVNYSL